MRIYELLWLLFLLFPVSVDQEAVMSCPRGCSRDRQTLVCLDITNKDLAVLYACINSSPEISVVDLRSKLVCDCDLLYLTNHHVNKDLLVFAPVECPPSMPGKCGMGTAPGRSHNHKGEIEIAGRMFSVQEDGLQSHLNNHIATLVQKLSKINDPKKRLEYLSAVYLNTQNAIDRINKGDVAKTKLEIQKPQVNLHVTTSQPPAGTKENPSEPQVVSDGNNVSPNQTHAQVKAYLNVNPKNHSDYNHSDQSGHNEHRHYHFKPYIVNTKKHIKHKLNKKPVSPTPSKPTTNSAKPKTHPTTPSTTTEEPVAAIFAPLINFLKGEGFQTQEEKKQPPYHVQVEQSGWENLVTDKSVTNKPNAQAKKQYRFAFMADDHKVKLVVFGSIIIFIAFVIICMLVAMTSRRRKLSNKPSKGDLEVSSYWGDKTVWKYLKGTVQTKYSRRESDEEKPASASSVIFNSCDFPRTNLVNMKRTGGGAAVSGLTAAIPQQPIMKDGIPQAPPIKPGAVHLSTGKVGKKEPPPTHEVHTRLLYKSGLYPGISNDSLTVLERARPSSMILVKSATDQAIASTSAVASKKDATTQRSEDASSSITGLESGSPEKSPRLDATSVSSDENLERKLFLVNYGHKSGYAVSQDVKGTVKVYQPAKFTSDMVGGGTSLHMEDQKFVDVVNTRMSYADRERARIARKKRLTRIQMFTG